MLENQPDSGRTMALETRYEVSTQVLSSLLAERLPAMCGSETLAMLVSSTSMKVASTTTIEISQGLIVISSAPAAGRPPAAMESVAMGGAVSEAAGRSGAARNLINGINCINCINCIGCIRCIRPGARRGPQ